MAQYVSIARPQCPCFSVSPRRVPPTMPTSANPLALDRVANFRSVGAGI
eukprot:COSAG05_NODE_25988_length_191_cov_3404.760870_1_plen_48_part_01